MTCLLVYPEHVIRLSHRRLSRVCWLSEMRDVVLFGGRLANEGNVVLFCGCSSSPNLVVVFVAWQMKRHYNYFDYIYGYYMNKWMLNTTEDGLLAHQQVGTCVHVISKVVQWRLIDRFRKITQSGKENSTFDWGGSMLGERRHKLKSRRDSLSSMRKINFRK